ncbi:hypothetical protein ACFL60_07635 [Candidatus Omnitrophota bacterium]
MRHIKRITNIAAILIGVLICQDIVYASDISHLRAPIGIGNKRLNGVFYKAIKAAVEKVFGEYTLTVQADATVEILLVEKELLIDKVRIELDIDAERVAPEVRVLIRNLIKSKLRLVIEAREKSAREDLMQARSLTKEYLYQGEQNPAMYEQIIELFERARHRYEVITICTGYRDDVLVQQSNTHIEMERFRQQAFDIDSRPNIIVSILTSDRPASLERLLQSLLDELLIFPYGLRSRGETTKLKLVIVDNSIDPVMVARNLDLLQEFATKTTIPIYRVDITGAAFPHNYAYPLQVAGVVSDSFGDSEALQCVLDDDTQFKTLVPLSSGLFGIRHVFPYFDKARFIMEDKDVLEIDGGITGVEGTTPFRTLFGAISDLLGALQVFSHLQPSDRYHPDMDIRYYTDNYYTNPELSAFASKRLVPRLRIPRENETLTAGAQFKIYCQLLGAAIYGFKPGKVYVYYPANYTVGPRGDILLTKNPQLAVGGNRWARFGASKLPFFTPPYMRRLHQAHSQVINHLPDHPGSYRAILPLYHDRPFLSAEMEDTTFAEVVRKGVMSKMMAAVFDRLLDKTAGDDFTSRLRNLQQYLRENYSLTESPLRDELLQMEQQIWSTYAQDMFAEIKHILDQIDHAGYLTSHKYFWNRDSNYRVAVEELKRFYVFMRTHYDPSSSFLAHLEKIFRIGEGYLIDQIIHDLRDIDLDNINQVSSEALKHISLVKSQTIQKDTGVPGSKYYHTLYTPRGYYGDEVISALQKEIRRGSPNAIFWAWEMMRTDERMEIKLWERLLTISVEDVGLGNLQALQVIWELRDKYFKQPAGSSQRDEIALNAVKFLLESVKDRFGDEAYLHNKIYYPEVTKSQDKGALFRQVLEQQDMLRALDLGIALMRSGNETIVLHHLEKVGEQKGKEASDLISVIAKSVDLIQDEDKRLFLIHGILCLCSMDLEALSTISEISQLINAIAQRPVNDSIRKFLIGSQLEIKDAYLDLHTRRGKAFGRDIRHFILNSAQLANERRGRDQRYLQEIISSLADQQDAQLLNQQLPFKNWQTDL